MKPQLGFLALGAGFLALFLITAQLVFSNTTQALDAQLALAIYNANLGLLLASLRILSSEYGRGYLWTGVTLTMLLLGKRNTKQLALELALLFMAGIITGDLIKLVAYRPRPFDTVPGIIPRITEAPDSSFPSGHALIVTIGALFTLAKFQGKKPRLTALLLTIEAAIVSYSRVYLGVHYPLDVFAGVFIAGAIVFLGLSIIEGHHERFQSATLLVEQALRNLRIPEIL